MSDTGRKNLSDKLQEGVTPESQKSTFDKAKESVTDSVDKVQGQLQPEENKSASQGVSDAIQKGHDDASSGKSFSESAQEYVDAAKKNLNEAAEYVSSSINKGKEDVQEYIDSHKK
ncbi:hypothetical protein WICMUC_002177 [Wickerhamomyces mucosus]|uniref:12 kDa heat shock protein n=1 Tax=Wickerhamomyces mucosus TaxID=1378264 RepID=A0A9P8PRC3_9ASCO|nr:hypothetical protein WICMUC_002177 [Wickerhamomyces mucosus]